MKKKRKEISIRWQLNQIFDGRATHHKIYLLAFFFKKLKNYLFSYSKVILSCKQKLYNLKVAKNNFNCLIGRRLQLSNR